MKSKPSNGIKKNGKYVAKAAAFVLVCVSIFIGIIHSFPGASVFVVVLIAVVLFSEKPLALLDLIIQAMNSAAAVLAALLLCLWAGSHLDFINLWWAWHGYEFVRSIPFVLAVSSLPLLALGGVVGAYRGAEIGRARQLVCVCLLAICLFFGVFGLFASNVSGDAGLGFGLAMGILAPVLMFAPIGWVIGRTAKSFMPRH